MKTKLLTLVFLAAFSGNVFSAADTGTIGTIFTHLNGNIAFTLSSSSGALKECPTSNGFVAIDSTVPTYVAKNMLANLMHAKARAATIGINTSGCSTQNTSWAKLVDIYNQ